MTPEKLAQMIARDAEFTLTDTPEGWAEEALKDRRELLEYVKSLQSAENRTAVTSTDRTSIAGARAFLNAADVFYEYDPTDPDEDGTPQTLNMNDVWGWALAWRVRVPDEKLPELAHLVWHYGWAGALYWVSRENKDMRSEFHDNNRAIDFVRHEEQIRQETPDSSARAYREVHYVLGSPRNVTGHADRCAVRAPLQEGSVICDCGHLDLKTRE